MPALNHLRIRRMMRRSPIRCSRKRSSLADFVEEAPDVGVQDPVHLRANDPGRQGIQRIMLAPLRSEPMREPEEVFLVDRVQHRDRCPLDDLVFQSRDRERALAAIWLWYIPPPGRLRPIRSPVDPILQIAEPTLEIGLVVLPCDPVYPGRGIPLESEECQPEQVDIHMVEERGEPLLLPLPCGLSYALQRL
jgi:hypothetical protein